MPLSRSAVDAKYLGDLTEFVALMDEHSRDKWTLNKSEDGFWLKQSVMIKNGSETLNRQTHILRSLTYDVPVLWFNFYHRDGRPLRLDEISDLLSKNDLAKCSTISRLIMQEIHRYYGVPFFFIDPRNTRRQMEELPANGNSIVRWLSIYGSIIGMKLPDEVLLSAGLNPQASHSMDFLRGCDSLSSNQTLSRSTCISINEENEVEIDEDVEGDRDEGDPIQRDHVQAEVERDDSIKDKMVELTISSVPESLDSAHDSPVSTISQ